MCIRDRSPLVFFRIVGFISGKFFVTNFLRPDPCGMGENELGRIAPVSYTHLDVYKRQLSVRMNCIRNVFKLLLPVLCLLAGSCGYQLGGTKPPKLEFRCV